ncbi:MAG: class I SAM-dependent methyltransferase [Hyphomicrobiaceae bacterium]
MRSWVDFWNSDHAIYVNDRHKALHAQAVAADIVGHIPSGDAVVLDHGCGEALYAEDVARHCGRLILCEAAPRVRETLTQRVQATGNVEVIDPDGAARLPDGSLDLVVANSLLQYLKLDELEALLDLWRDKIKPDGRIVIADVIPPGVSPFTDAAALVRFAAKGGFLLPALGGLVKTAMSDYGRIRQALGFSMYQEGEFVSLLARHGLKAERVHPNFGHNQARMTFMAVPAG